MENNAVAATLFDGDSDGNQLLQLGGQRTVLGRLSHEASEGRERLRDGLRQRGEAGIELLELLRRILCHGMLLVGRPYPPICAGINSLTRASAIVFSSKRRCTAKHF